jgi:hypothetical protein
MPGQLGVGLGLGGSVFAQGYPSTGAFVPAASTVPEGPATITQRAFGVPSAGAGGSKGLTCAGIGTAALALLAFIWWTLPR